MTDKQHLLQTILPIIEATATFLREHVGGVRQSDVEVKHLNALVSYVDRQAEEILVEGLSKAFPEAGFITEEETIVTERKTYNWIIDPLDGTTNYLHGIPVYAISVALECEGKVVLGVVCEAGKNEYYTAVRNEGAFLNGNPIRVSQKKQLADTLIATGFPYYRFDRMDDFIETLTDCFRHTRGVRRIGTAATDLAYTAVGRFDAYYEYGLSPWDVAAGSLIASEAGARVCDFSGGTNFLFGEEIVVMQPHISDAFWELLAPLRKK